MQNCRHFLPVLCLLLVRWHMVALGGSDTETLCALGWLLQDGDSQKSWQGQAKPSCKVQIPRERIMAARAKRKQADESQVRECA